MISIFYLNNNGSGFADNVNVAQGTTVGTFLADKGVNIASFLIRLNRQPVSADTVLQTGDRLTVTPLKIEGSA